MLNIEENKLCFQCDIYKQVVSFKTPDTCKEVTICESCLDSYISSIRQIVDAETSRLIRQAEHFKTIYRGLK